MNDSRVYVLPEKVVVEVKVDGTHIPEEEIWSKFYESIGVSDDWTKKWLRKRYSTTTEFDYESETNIRTIIYTTKFTLV